MSKQEEFESPVDLPGRMLPQRHPLRWTTIAIATASLFLLATNAVSLRGWIEEQPAGPIQVRLAALAVRWEGVTQSLHLGAPRAALHQLWKSVQAARFNSDGPENDQR